MHRLEITCNVGINIFPFIDRNKSPTLFRMVPFGNAKPYIRDNNGCGVVDLPVGSSIQWQFDRMVEYTYDDVHVSFIVVKVPGSPPPNFWNASLEAKPEKQSSDDVEEIVRAKFHIPPTAEWQGPCWLHGSIIENERDMWKKTAHAADVVYKKLFQYYVAMEQEYTRMNKDEDELIERHNALFDENKLLKEELARRETDAQFTEKALQQIRDAMVCTTCLDVLDDKGPVAIATCGHFLHTQCLRAQKATRNLHCPQCNSQMTWRIFSGFTSIVAALKELKTKRDAQ
jgi:hypothetical protein